MNTFGERPGGNRYKEGVTGVLELFSELGLTAPEYMKKLEHIGTNVPFMDDDGNTDIHTLDLLFLQKAASLLKESYSNSNREQLSEEAISEIREITLKFIQDSLNSITQNPEYFYIPEEKDENQKKIFNEKINALKTNVERSLNKSFLRIPLKEVVAGFSEVVQEIDQKVVENQKQLKNILQRKISAAESQLLSIKNSIILGNQNLNYKSKFKLLNFFDSPDEIKKLKTEIQFIEQTQKAIHDSVRQLRSPQDRDVFLDKTNLFQQALYQILIERLREDIQQCVDIGKRNEALNYSDRSEIEKIKNELSELEKNLQELSTYQPQSSELIKARNNLIEMLPGLEKKLHVFDKSVKTLEENYSNQKRKIRDLLDNVQPFHKKLNDMSGRISKLNQKGNMEEVNQSIRKLIDDAKNETKAVFERKEPKLTLEELKTLHDKFEKSFQSARRQEDSLKEEVDYYVAGEEALAQAEKYLTIINQTTETGYNNSDSLEGLKSLSEMVEGLKSEANQERKNNNTSEYIRLRRSIWKEINKNHQKGSHLLTALDQQIISNKSSHKALEDLLNEAETYLLKDQKLHRTANEIVGLKNSAFSENTITLMENSLREIMGQAKTKLSERTPRATQKELLEIHSKLTGELKQAHNTINNLEKEVDSLKKNEESLKKQLNSVKEYLVKDEQLSNVKSKIQELKDEENKRYSQDILNKTEGPLEALLIQGDWVLEGKESFEIKTLRDTEVKLSSQFHTLKRTIASLEEKVDYLKVKETAFITIEYSCAVLNRCEGEDKKYITDQIGRLLNNLKEKVNDLQKKVDQDIQGDLVSLTGSIQKATQDAFNEVETLSRALEKAMSKEKQEEFRQGVEEYFKDQISFTEEGRKNSQTLYKLTRFKMDDEKSTLVNPILSELLQKARKLDELIPNFNKIDVLHEGMKKRKQELGDKVDAQRRKPTEEELHSVGVVISQEHDMQKEFEKSLLKFIKRSIKQLKEKISKTSSKDERISGLLSRLQKISDRADAERNIVTQAIQGIGRAFERVLTADLGLKDIPQDDSISKIAEDFSKLIKELDLPSMPHENIRALDLSSLSIQELNSLFKELEYRIKASNTQFEKEETKLKKKDPKTILEKGSHHAELIEKQKNLVNEISLRRDKAQKKIKSRTRQLKSEINPLMGELRDYIDSKDYKSLRLFHKDTAVVSSGELNQVLNIDNKETLSESEKKYYTAFLDIQNAINSVSPESLKNSNKEFKELNQEIERIKSCMKDPKELVKAKGKIAFDISMLRDKLENVQKEGDSLSRTSNPTIEQLHRMGQVEKEINDLTASSQKLQEELKFLSQPGKNNEALSARLDKLTQEKDDKTLENTEKDVENAFKLGNVYRKQSAVLKTFHDFIAEKRQVQENLLKGLLEKAQQRIEDKKSENKDLQKIANQIAKLSDPREVEKTINQVEDSLLTSIKNIKIALEKTDPRPSTIKELTKLHQQESEKIRQLETQNISLLSKEVNYLEARDFFNQKAETISNHLTQWMKKIEQAGYLTERMVELVQQVKEEVSVFQTQWIFKTLEKDADFDTAIITMDDAWSQTEQTIFPLQNLLSKVELYERAEKELLQTINDSTHQFSVLSSAVQMLGSHHFPIENKALKEKLENKAQLDETHRKISEASESLPSFGTLETKTELDEGVRLLVERIDNLKKLGIEIDSFSGDIQAVIKDEVMSKFNQKIAGLIDQVNKLKIDPLSPSSLKDVCLKEHSSIIKNLTSLQLKQGETETLRLEDQVTKMLSLEKEIAKISSLEKKVGYLETKDKVFKESEEKLKDLQILTTQIKQEGYLSQRLSELSSSIGRETEDFRNSVETKNLEEIEDFAEATASLEESWQKKKQAITESYNRFEKEFEYTKTGIEVEKNLREFSENLLTLMVNSKEFGELFQSQHYSNKIEASLIEEKNTIEKEFLAKIEDIVLEQVNVVKAGEFPSSDQFKTIEALENGTKVLKERVSNLQDLIEKTDQVHNRTVQFLRNSLQNFLNKENDCKERFTSINERAKVLKEEPLITEESKQVEKDVLGSFGELKDFLKGTHPITGLTKTYQETFDQVARISALENKVDYFEAKKKVVEEANQKLSDLEKLTTQIKEEGYINPILTKLSEGIEKEIIDFRNSVEAREPKEIQNFVEAKASLETSWKTKDQAITETYNRFKKEAEYTKTGVELKKTLKVFSENLLTLMADSKEFGELFQSQHYSNKVEQYLIDEKNSIEKAFLKKIEDIVVEQVNIAKAGEFQSSDQFKTIETLEEGTRVLEGRISKFQGLITKADQVHNNTIQFLTSSLKSFLNKEDDCRDHFTSINERAKVLKEAALITEESKQVEKDVLGSFGELKEFLKGTHPITGLTKTYKETFEQVAKISALENKVDYFEAKKKVVEEANQKLSDLEKLTTQIKEEGYINPRLTELSEGIKKEIIDFRDSVEARKPEEIQNFVEAKASLETSWKEKNEALAGLYNRFEKERIYTKIGTEVKKTVNEFSEKLLTYVGLTH